MASIKARIERLEALSPKNAKGRVTEIHRVIVGEFNVDGSPVVVIRRLAQPPAAKF